ncbi:MAG: hemin uptake protein HemP [Ramlibacter sp.]|nr:hemin uptake protein HemP [Ramlibacter sp.]
MDRRPAPAKQPQQEEAPTLAVAKAVVLASSDLLRGQRMVEIRHNGEVYRLQSTRLGKLILTK